MKSPLIKIILRCIATLLILAIFSSIAVSWIASRHIVRTENGWIIIPKHYLTLQESCTDIRSWNWQTFDDHPALRDALIRHGYAELVPARPPAAAQERLAQSWTNFQKNAALAMRNFQRDVADHFADWICELDKKWFGE